MVGNFDILQVGNFLYGCKFYFIMVLLFRVTEYEGLHNILIFQFQSNKMWRSLLDDGKKRGCIENIQRSGSTGYGDHNLFNKISICSSVS